MIKWLILQVCQEPLQTDFSWMTSTKEVLRYKDLCPGLGSGSLYCPIKDQGYYQVIQEALTLNTKDDQSSRLRRLKHNAYHSKLKPFISILKATGKSRG